MGNFLKGSLGSSYLTEGAMWDGGLPKSDEDWAKYVAKIADNMVYKIPVGGSFTIERCDPNKEPSGYRYILTIKEPLG